MKLSDKQMDEVLRHTLQAEQTMEPSAQLQRQTIQNMKERYGMEQNGTGRRKKFCTAVLTAALVIGIPAGAFAAWHLMSPAQVATQLQEAALAEAFANDNAITLNQVQEGGDYKFTLMGLISGADCSEILKDNGNAAQQMYAVVAIERLDGAPMPDTDSADYAMEQFVVSPLIQGEKPWQVNIFSMKGSSAAFVQDGVEYRLVQYDNLLPFADREVYLSVTDSVPDNQMYVQQSADGSLVKNPDYDGINVLFTLPLDTAQADGQKADALLQQWLHDDTEDEAGTASGDEEMQQRYQAVITQGRLKENSRKPLEQDANGFWWYKSDDGAQLSVSAEVAEGIERSATCDEGFTLMGDDTSWTAVQFGRDEQGVLYGQMYVLNK